MHPQLFLSSLTSLTKKEKRCYLTNTCIRDLSSWRLQDSTRGQKMQSIERPIARVWCRHKIPSRRWPYWRGLCPYELTSTAKVNHRSWLQRDLNSHLRVTIPLLNQLSYRVNWDQYVCFIHFKCTRDSRDNSTLDLREDAQSFDSTLESSLG